MTDMRRTLLWVVFTMSLVLLWDAWNRHTGQPTLFGGAPRPAASAPAAGPAPAGVPAAVPAATSATPATPAATGAATPAPTAAAAAGERIELATDRFKATFDSVGGTLVRLELLGYRDNVDARRNVVLFDQSGKRLYLAQTGLITAQPGVALPTHLTPMAAAPGPRVLADGSNELVLRFEGEAAGGVKLAKTYTLQRGSYTIGVKHEVINGSAAAVSPQLYLQLARDGNPPEGESSFYFTFTGPAMYTDQAKFQKIEFKDIEKGSTDHARQANDGWVAMVQHYFASAWLLKDNAPREFRTAKVSDNHYTVAMVTPLGDLAPGATKVHEATLFAGPQEENKLAALAPGLELVKDYGWFTMLAKPLFWLLDQLNRLIGNWGWAIVALVVLLKIAFYWLNASAYRSMAKMKAINPRVMELRERHKDDPQKMQQEMMRNLPRGKGQPAGQLPAHPGADALLHRAVLGAAVQRGDAQRALDRLDHRPGRQGPLVHPAHPDDGLVAVPGVAEPDAARSHAGQAHVDHAAGLLVHVLLLPGRPGAVLVDEQPAVDRAAVVHQQAARGAVAQVACRRRRRRRDNAHAGAADPANRG